MARIAGVNIPTNKRVVIALRYIHGIGPVNAKEICEQGQYPAFQAGERAVATPKSCRSARSSTATMWSRATCAAKCR